MSAALRGGQCGRQGRGRRGSATLGRVIDSDSYGDWTAPSGSAGVRPAGGTSGGAAFATFLNVLLGSTWSGSG